MEEGRAKALQNIVAKGGTARSQVEFLAHNLRKILQEALDSETSYARYNGLRVLLYNSLFLVADPLRVTDESIFDNPFAGLASQGWSEDEAIYRVSNFNDVRFMPVMYKKMQEFWRSIYPTFVGNSGFRSYDLVVLTKHYYASEAYLDPYGMMYIDISARPTKCNECLLTAYALACLLVIKDAPEDSHKLVTSVFTDPVLKNNPASKVLVGKLPDLRLNDMGIASSIAFSAYDALLSVLLPTKFFNEERQLPLKEGDTIQLIKDLYEISYLLNIYSKYVNVYAVTSLTGATIESQVGEADLYNFYEATRGHEYQREIDAYMSPHYSAKYCYQEPIDDFSKS